MTEPRELEGQVIVVTGGAGAIGGAVAHSSESAGATVVIVDRDVEDDGRSRFALDVSRSTDVADTFGRILAEHGRIDGFVHAAGVSTSRASKQRISPQLNHRFDEAYPRIDGLTATEDDEWERLISVNLSGAFYCLRAVLRHMVDRGAGRVVMISSNAGLVGEAGAAAYSASKGGAQLLMQAAAAETAGSGVRVNAVAPGPTMTPLVAESAAAGQNFLVRIPARRVAAPAEIARAVHFLLADRDGFIVGETISVNGGILIR